MAVSIHSSYAAVRPLYAWPFLSIRYRWHFAISCVHRSDIDDACTQTNCTCAHTCAKTQIAHTNCAVILWAVTAEDDGSFFLPLSAFPFISPPKTTSSIHLWLPSSPSSTLSLSFLGQHAISPAPTWWRNGKALYNFGKLNSAHVCVHMHLI